MQVCDTDGDLISVFTYERKTTDKELEAIKAFAEYTSVSPKETTIKRFSLAKLDYALSKGELLCNEVTDYVAQIYLFYERYNENIFSGLFDFVKSLIPRLYLKIAYQFATLQITEITDKKLAKLLFGCYSED